MHQPKYIHWFRRDLRLSDNPAYYEACQRGDVLPVYIIDTDEPDDVALGRANLVWLHHSLASLNKSLQGHLHIQRGSVMQVLQNLVARFDITGIYWNRCYDGYSRMRDQHIKESFAHLDIKSFNGSLLWEPWTIKKSDGTAYRVFTPFYRRGCMSAPPPRMPLPEPQATWISAPQGLSVDDCGFLPSLPWAADMMIHWQAGEAAAWQVCEEFIEHGLASYKIGRDFPAKPYVSRLSPYLQSGEISPNQVWAAVRSAAAHDQVDHFCSELGWREFSYSQLFENPDIAMVNIQKKFDQFQWSNQQVKLEAWKKGLTGVPMVDAGMRQLYQTGYMHNRVRMIVGSFLVKNLLCDWRHGERWFWDCLVDADHASNRASWQWVAGCGADAAPYFRIFNPVTQGMKFDPEGDYIKKYIPELSRVPVRYIHAPWEAPSTILQQRGCILGQHYPRPIVNLKESRQEALDAFKALKGQN